MRSLRLPVLSGLVGGAIVAADDGTALDPDYAATGLSDAERAQLWTLAPHALAPILVRDHLLAAGALPALPSGDKMAGGELHGVAARTQILVPPQLLQVWPPGAATLDIQDPANADDARRFHDAPQLEITVSRAIAGEAVKFAGTWLHAFLATRDGQILGFAPIPASFANSSTTGGDRQAITIGLDRASFQSGQQEVLVIIHPEAAPPGEAPLGAANPQILLDADFAGTVLDPATVLAIFDGDLQLKNHIDSLGAAKTEGAALFDGKPGGLMHYSFTVLSFPS